MTGTVKIPFLDLVSPHVELQKELSEVFKVALQTAGFIGGPVVEGFERDFARYCDVQYCVGVGSGTDALRFMLIAAGIKEGDVVVTVPNTFIATTEAISQAGARPDFVDIDARTYNMDPRSLQKYMEVNCYVDNATGHLVNRRLQKRVAAIIPVHLYGQTANMDPILKIAERYNLPVFEDACQAHGAEYFSSSENRWKRAGSIGSAAAFSFYPGKNLGACGEAGAVTTNDAALAQRVRTLRDHGQAQKYYHDVEGYNGRMDAIQAGILQVKLRHLPAWNQKRRESASCYRELLSAVRAEARIPFEPSWVKPVYHLFVISVERRDELQQHLAKGNIGTGIHYPIPLHLQKAYQHLGYKAGDFPVSESSAATILSLPMFPGLGTAQQSYVVQQLTAFLSEKAQTSTTAAACGD
jgi:dTDP-4-amino-4,6-dideoxygalactose transaminase